MMNALRYIRFGLVVLMERKPRGRHASRAWMGVLASALGGAAILTMPIWMILMGVI